MYSIKLIYFILFGINPFRIFAEISDKRLCIDIHCSEPISRARTVLSYNSIEDGVLSFKPNQDVTIFSYGAGVRENLWGVEINGRRGYIPKTHVKEYTKTKLQGELLLLNTENYKPQVPSEPVTPEKVLKDYEVIDGTTLILNQTHISPSSTERSVLPTVTPPSEDKTFKNSDEELSPPIKLSEKDGEDGVEVDEEDQNHDDEEEEEEEEDDKIHLAEEETEKSTSSSINLEKGTSYNEVRDLMKSNHILAPQNVLKTLMYSSDPLQGTPSSASVTTDPMESSVLSPSTLSKSPSQQNIEASIETNKLPLPINSNPEEVGVLTKNNDIPLFNPPPKENVVFSKPRTDEVVLDNSNKIPLPPALKSNHEEAVVAKKHDQLLSQSPHSTQENIIGDLEKHRTESATPVEPNLNGVVNENMVEGHPDAFLNDIYINKDNDKNIKDNIKSLPSKTENHIQIKDLPKSVDTQDEISVLPISNITSEVPSILVSKEENKDEFKNDEHNKTSTLEVKPENVQEDKQPAQTVSSTQEINVPLNEAAENLHAESSILPEILHNIAESTEVNPSDNNIEELQDKKLEKDIKESNYFDQLTADTKKDKCVFEVNHEVSNDPLIENSLNIEDISSSPLDSHEQETTNKAADSGGFMSGFLSYFGSDESSNVDETTPKDNVNKKNSEPYSLDESLDQVSNNEIDDETHSHHVISKNEDQVQYCSSSDTNCPILQNSQEELTHNSNIIDGNKLEDFTENIEIIDANHETTINENNGGTISEMFKYSLPLLFNEIHPDIFIYLLTTAISVILFLFGYLAMDKSKRVGPLIARINKLEQQLLITMKENEMLQEGATPIYVNNLPQVEEKVSNEEIENLTQKLAEMQINKIALEEQIQALEKELDTSTEVGMELNKIVSEMLNSSNNGSDVIKESVEQMKRQLLEHQDTINNMNQALSFKETENHELKLDLDISNKKVSNLQAELDKMVEKILKIEEEKDQQQNTLEQEIVLYQQKYTAVVAQEDHLQNDLQVLKTQLSQAIRDADIKVKEFNELKSSLKDIKLIKNNSEAIKSLLDVTSLKAEFQQLQVDSNKFKEQLSLEQQAHSALGIKYQAVLEESNVLREKYDTVDKQKLEIETKLEVLNSYFKEKENQLQKEISKYESLWVVKEGEATSTTERIKYMQEELQNYKSQNEILKQEIVSQEVELKSQISVLEKKVHENWVTNRQLERKLEEAKQEGAQLRNRLTLSERAMTDGNSHMRILSPLQNGEMPLSPPPIESPASPQMLYGRDHITKSPPLAGLPPPPFLPPPIGGHFMTTHLPGMPPFMPPPPSMFPGDHRLPPLGRISSPPPMMLRYSPDSTAYSGYDRNSPSPPYNSEYGASPPPMRSYSPYDREDRREYKRPHNRSNNRNNKGSSHLNSGSGRSNDSLDELYPKSSKNA